MKYLKSINELNFFKRNRNPINENNSESIKPFKSKLKVKYDSSLGMWVINGHSLQRTDIDGKTFFDKKSANEFKKNIDNQDFYFYNDNK